MILHVEYFLLASSNIIIIIIIIIIITALDLLLFPEKLHIQ